MKNRILMAFSLMIPLGTALAADDMATIITQNAKASECISRVAIQQIDGEEKFVSPQMFTLEPGRHSLRGTVALDTSYPHCKAVRGNATVDIPPLEADFEAGKRYYVGFDHSSSNIADWGYVIWKTED